MLKASRLLALNSPAKAFTPHQLSARPPSSLGSQLAVQASRIKAGSHLTHHSGSSSSSNTARQATLRSVSTAAGMERAGSLPLAHQDVETTLEMYDASMPKCEINALRFLADNPTYDGRGTVVAIFDTGVDPGAAGLQVTTDGRPKVVDVVDCTGAGDVSTSTIRRAASDGTIESLSGRRMALNPEWANPSGEWHVGQKLLFELLPGSVANRGKAERRKAVEEAHRAALAAATSDLAKFDKDPKAAVPNEKERERVRSELEGRLTILKDAAKNLEDPGPKLDVVTWHDGTAWRCALDTSELTPASAEAVPPNKRGVALKDFEPITNYKAERKYGTFPDPYATNYAINIYDEGNVTSIVVDSGAHGTHVAGITAAHFPQDPGMNGVAPGAQIISCKIGDTRLGSMETGTGCTRALIATLEHKADLINMSFGEPTTTPNSGRFIDLANEVVHKHGVIFVSSAGNAGPALTTVGAPGGTSSSIYAIGAYVSPALAASGHSVLQIPAAGIQYNWSSRGPTADGDLGVAFSAPGGAIAPVPTWSQQKRQLMNGTSMSSPCACGGIALILSGMKQAGPDVVGKPSPARLRRAIEATCLKVGEGKPEDVLTYGAGLIQVDAAFDYLRRSVMVDVPDFRYEVSVAPAGASAPPGGLRGIYMREPHEARAPRAFTATITPKLHEDAPTSEMLEIEQRLILEPSAPWICAPSVILMHHGTRMFQVSVDPRGLPPGLHAGQVAAYDAVNRWRGPLFKLPVTVVKPLEVPSSAIPPPQPPAAGMATAQPGPVNEPSGARDADQEAAAPDVDTVRAASGRGASPQLLGADDQGVTPDELMPALGLGPYNFKAGTEHRQFVAVPEGSTWAELVLKGGKYDTPKVFFIRATQLAPQSNYKEHETRSMVTLSPGSEWSTNFRVIGGSTMEVTLAQFWTSPGESSLTGDLSFHGVTFTNTGPQGIMMDGAAGVSCVIVRAPLRNERIRPEAKLTHLHIPVRPTAPSGGKASLMEPLASPRDTLPNGRIIYRMVLTYKFTPPESGKHKITVPGLNTHIYDNALESQMYMVHEVDTKKVIHIDDAYPEFFQLTAGQEVEIRLALRHDDTELLEKLSDKALVIERKLDSPITLPVYACKRSAVTASGSTVSDTLLKAGDSMSLYIGQAPDNKLPKDASAGRLLSGKLSLGQLSKGNGAAPAGAALMYSAQPQPEKPKDNKAGKDDAPAAEGKGSEGEAGTAEAAASTEQKLQESIRDTTIKFLKDLDLNVPAQRDLYNKQLKQLKEASPKHLPLLLEHLRKLDAQVAKAAGAQKVDSMKAVVAAADEAIAAVDAREIAVATAIKNADESPELKAAKKDAEGKRDALCEALHRKAAILLGLEEELNYGGKAPWDPASLPAAAPSATSASGTASEGITIEATSGEEGGAASSDAPQAAAAQPVASANVVGKVAFDNALFELRKHVDTAEGPYLALHAKAEARACRPGSALRAVDRALDNIKDGKKPSGPSSSGSTAMPGLKAWLEWRHALLKASPPHGLGYEHLATLQKAANAARFPASYPLF